MQSGCKNLFLTSASGRKYLSLRLPFVWLQHSNMKGKQAVLLESLFKESQSWWAPPTPTPANRESALSRTKTSQARPFVHTRQKNAQRRSLLLPPSLLRMFVKKAETTGTTVRLPYLEKRAQTFRGGSLHKRGERAVSRCRTGSDVLCFWGEAMDFLK